jgi:hypothetical protein
MKKIFNTYFAVIFLIAILMLISSCGEKEHIHEFGEWTKVSEATCTSQGMLVSICKCGEQKEQIVPVKGHTEGKWILDYEPTCDEEGSEHQICSVCYETLKTASIPAKGHAYVDATCTNPKKCTTCGKTSGSALGHSFVVTIRQEATCERTGIKSYKCSTCNYTYQEEIKATGHNYFSEITSEATCTRTGTKKYTCDNCAKTYTEVIPKLEHQWKNATCTSPMTCNLCGKTSGSALGHNKGSDGYCKVCYEKITIDMKTVVGSPNDCETISYFGFCYYKNSVDGIKVCWGGKNLSGKTIKYYTVTIYFYNSVDDPAYSEITGKSSKTLKYVGPIKPNEDLVIFSIVDYVPVCSKVLIGEITLEYTDGTSDTGWYGWYTKYNNKNIR